MREDAPFGALFSRLFDSDLELLRGLSLEAAGLWWFLIARRRQLDHGQHRQDAAMTETVAAAAHFGVSRQTVWRAYQEIVRGIAPPVKRGPHGAFALKPSAVLPPGAREAEPLFSPPPLPNKPKRKRAARPNVPRGTSAATRCGKSVENGTIVPAAALHGRTSSDIQRFTRGLNASTGETLGAPQRDMILRETPDPARRAGSAKRGPARHTTKPPTGGESTEDRQRRWLAYLTGNGAPIQTDVPRGTSNIPTACTPPVRTDDVPT